MGAFEVHFELILIYLFFFIVNSWEIRNATTKLPDLLHFFFFLFLFYFLWLFSFCCCYCIFVFCKLYYCFWSHALVTFWPMKLTPSAYPYIHTQIRGSVEFRHFLYFNRGFPRNLWFFCIIFLILEYLLSSLPAIVLNRYKVYVMVF